MTGKIQIQSTSNLGTNISEAMIINPTIAQNLMSEDSTTAISAATLIDTFARSITGLTTNTYNDTNVTLTKQTEDHATI